MRDFSAEIWPSSGSTAQDTDEDILDRAHEQALKFVRMLVGPRNLQDFFRNGGPPEWLREMIAAETVKAEQRE
jgi:hypothetical protein